MPHEIRNAPVADRGESKNQAGSGFGAQHTATIRQPGDPVRCFADVLAIGEQHRLPPTAWRNDAAIEIGKRQGIPLPVWPTADDRIRSYLSETPRVDALARLVRESERLATELVTLSYWDHADELMGFWIERGRIIRKLAEAVGE